MNNKNLKIIEISALILAVIVTVVTMLYAAAWSIDFGAILFVLWAVSPYICVFLAGSLVRKFTSIPKTSLIFSIVSLLMLVFTLLIYPGVFFDQSSTFALVFLVIPVYLFIGSFIVVGTGLMLAIFLKRPAKKIV